MLNQYVMTHFTDMVGKVLNMELQRQLLPLVNAKMDQLQNQMQLEMVQKLNVFDKTVKENIAQVCKSKVIRQYFNSNSLLLSLKLYNICPLAISRSFWQVRVDWRTNKPANDIH